MPFSRYRPLVDDWPAFAAALARPLPVTVRLNPLRAPGAEGIAEARRWLAADGVEAEPIPWRPDAFRLSGPGVESPGSLLAVVAGLVHLQEEVSLVPVGLLDPRPGERVIDLCAAPGGKTAEIAAAMEGRGTLVANDLSWRRLAPLGTNLDRLGVTNAALSTCDAASFPFAPGSAGGFDRVLADVPCTCEGTTRKSPEVMRWMGEDARRRAAGLQRAILERAVALCRPGGRIVYSTCTYAPEENEAVVAAVLAAVRAREGAGALTLAEARIEGLRGHPGLASWEGSRFGPKLGRALRVWPHDNDTGGFFVAVLERGHRPAGKAGTPAVPPPSPSLDVLPPEERRRWLEPLAERFRFAPGTFDGLDLMMRGRARVVVAARGMALPAAPVPRAAGLPLLHTGMRDPKLTTVAAMAFGTAAEANVVELSAGRLRDYLAHRDLVLEATEAERTTGPGYVLVRHRGLCLGVGWLRVGEGGERSLRSFFPKRWGARGAD